MAELSTESTNIEVTEVNGTETEVKESESAEVERLRAELAKQKTALDKATKEAAENKRLLRARQSAEEAAAEEAKETAEAQARELAELRKKFAVAETSKKIMAFVGDEATSNVIAESLYGAENIDNVVSAIQKAWTAKEKSIRMTFSTIPSPGIGVNDGATTTRAQLDAMNYNERAEFAAKYPDEYEHLMGRK